MTTYILFGLFALTLFGIAAKHQKAMLFAIAGLCAVTVVRFSTGFHVGEHLLHESKDLLNLGGLLLGFALLADFFERSHLPNRLTQVLPGGRLGAFLLLVLVCVLSAVLDNIAAALIGGSAAMALFGGKVHIGYLAAIVAASNAGGAGSVVGDTTTTMMWIAGASPWDVAHAAVGSVAALAVIGFFASRQQNVFQPMIRASGPAVHVDYAQLGIVGLILVGAIGANIGLGMPAAGVWTAILLGALVRRPHWKVLGGAVRGTVFLLCLVVSASMMPVEELPDASVSTAFGLGIVSAFFDNIPLTKLALTQGGFDWGLLAFAVGYGGSMLWFGSSAGVALSGFFPQAKSAVQWVRHGWHVALGYVLGFLAILFVVGWHPVPLKKDGSPPPKVGLAQPVR